MSVEHFDIAIVGGGMAGLALACALRTSEYRVALVEAREFAASLTQSVDTPEEFDPRVSALTVASARFLDSIGVWQGILAQRNCAFEHMHVWDAAGSAAIDFSANGLRQSCLGYIVENRVSLQALRETLKLTNNVALYCPERVRNIVTHSVDDQSVQVELESGNELTARLLVAADGGQSRIRDIAQFRTRQWSYGQRAIVTTARTAKPHQQTAWQRFLPSGPLAFLPLSTVDQRYCSIVWSATTARADELLAMDDDDFSSALAHGLEQRLGAIVEVAKRYSFPLQQCHATRYAKPGIALLGDAAHVIHPLAGQGANLGLQDVQVLAEELQRAEKRKLNPGALHVLQRYQRRRIGANLLMMGAVEGFNRLFAETALPLRWARNSGMQKLNALTPVKQHIMRQAMGL